MRRSLFFVFLGIALCFCAMTSAAQAQATRTWVSGVGDDANPCSRTAPCKTFPGAYSRTAAGGEIDALDPGGFGTITISKAITLDGGGGIVASILASSTYGVRVVAGPNDWVTLRNLRINAVPQYAFPGTSPVIFNSGGVLNIENCILQGGSAVSLDFEPSPGNHGDLHVNNSIIQDASAGGIFVSGNTPFNRASIVETTIINNGAFGVKVGSNSKVDVTRSLVAGTNVDGLLSTGGGMTVEGTTVTGGNGVGVHSTNAGIIWISNTTVTSNGGLGLSYDTGGTILSFLNNKVANNNNGGSQGAPTGPANPGPI